MGTDSAELPSQPPLRGPRWTALTETLQYGSILISDGDGAFVGAATDPLRGGRLDLKTLRRNAGMMALAPLMLDACRLLAQATPLTVARLERLGALPHQELLEAAELADQALAAMATLPLGDQS